MVGFYPKIPHEEEELNKHLLMKIIYEDTIIEKPQAPVLNLCLNTLNVTKFPMFVQDI